MASLLKNTLFVYVLSVLLVVINLFVGYATVASADFRAVGADVEPGNMTITKSILPLTNSGNGIIEEENHDIYSPMPKNCAEFDLYMLERAGLVMLYEEKDYEHYPDVIIPPPEV
ncbi:MAG: hypothetical protein ACK5MG_03885 [Bacteroidales bacterium]